jgi:small-conductance mechanosensitive channel
MEILKNIIANDWIIAGAIVLAGLILGIFFEKLISRVLHRLAGVTKWEWDDVVIKALRGVLVVWFTVGGLYIALLVKISLDPGQRDTIRKIIIALLLFSITLVIARAASGLIRLYSKKTRGGLPSTTLFSSIASILILITGIILILQNMGISITPLITALGIGGLAVALALQDTLSNLFAGFQIIISKQVRPGDYIVLESGGEGYITDVKWRNTTIRSLRSTKVFIVPNSKVASSIVTNYNLPRKLMWYRVFVGVAYDSNLEQVEKVTYDVARQLVEDFYGPEFGHEPVVRFREFGDSSINLSARLPVREFMDKYKIRSEFIKRLHRRYNEEGIEIPFPIRTVYMKNKAKDD